MDIWVKSAESHRETWGSVVQPEARLLCGSSGSIWSVQTGEGLAEPPGGATHAGAGPRDL